MKKSKIDRLFNYPRYDKLLLKKYQKATVENFPLNKLIKKQILLIQNHRVLAIAQKIVLKLL